MPPREGPGPPDDDGDDSHVELAKGTDKGKSDFSWWFMGGHHHGANAAKEKKGPDTSKNNRKKSSLNTEETICDRTIAKMEALRRNKIRSTSESSALDGGLLGTSPLPATDEGGRMALNVERHRQASKSAVHLGVPTSATLTPIQLEPEGNFTFDWWFHRKRRSSKNKSR